MKKQEEFKVMIVDDTETNIDLLLNTLADSYDVRVAMDGKTALDDIMADKPDLVLLDIMMPEMDGYEVCRRLKNNDETKDIPVIFLTAMKKDLDEAKGLLLGAVDYITKPFNSDLVKARVGNQLTLKAQRDELAKQNEILRENELLKDDIDRITRHDLKSPLSGIIGFPTLILMNEDLSEKHRAYLQKTVELGKMMLNMINLSLDLYKMEQKTYQFSPQEVNIIPVLFDIIAENEKTLASRNIQVRMLFDGREMDENMSFSVLGERLLCYSMLANIIKNALEASDNGKQITIDLSQDRTSSIRIHNESAVPESIRDTFFDKYVTYGKSKGTGLGTYSARLMAETMGAAINLDTSEERGTTITIEFPLQKSE